MIPKSRLQTDSINVQLLMQANKRGAETMFIASAPRALQIRLFCKKCLTAPTFYLMCLKLGIVFC